jgi:hypothetical protein
MIGQIDQYNKMRFTDKSSGKNKSVYGNKKQKQSHMSENDIGMFLDIDSGGSDSFGDNKE